MTSSAQATAARTELRLGGRTYTMHPLTDRDIAELDDWLRARLMRLARDSIPPDATEEERAETLRVAMLTASELTWLKGTGAKAMSCFDGLARMVWQGLRKEHPDLSYEQLRSLLLDPQTLEEAEAALARLNYREASEGDEKKTTQDAQDVSTVDHCIAPSAPATAGPPDKSQI